ncbi:hypothetical protein AQUCO_04700091v1 [Aquilegia coerulea]|uniref:Uncharacterized protein n=1 Tax=Aquilegia coerulea TaxID=218851 RepID=A0A2G5CLB9_AQUCA|nr:hypothetical protein AQUCO_04700091v1 [Aquilegia coerulea]
MAMPYSTAIISLVNGPVDKGHKKEDMSIAERAAQLGLPPLLSDICHRASDRDLPSLQLVRVASAEVNYFLSNPVYGYGQMSLVFWCLYLIIVSIPICLLYLYFVTSRG